MKEFVPYGAKIKGHRINSERASTQKELAHEIRVSERTLRAIENEDAPVGADVLSRLAKWFGVHREELVKSTGSTSVSGSACGLDPFQGLISDLAADRVVSRYDVDLAYATMDEGLLFKEAIRSHDVVCSIEIPLNDETADYAQELFEILNSLSWEKRGLRFGVLAEEEVAIRRRIKKLLVLLKGNDIWIYQTSFYRRLPERFEPLPKGEHPDMKSRLVIALGPPGEYGEESITVPIDHGQPFFLTGWKFAKEAVDGGA